MQLNLDWQPAINVFEIERFLVLSECEGVVGVKALQFFLITHHKYLNQNGNASKSDQILWFVELYAIKIDYIQLHHIMGLLSFSRDRDVTHG